MSNNENLGPRCPKCQSDDLGFWPYVGQIACNKCSAVIGEVNRPYPGLGMFRLADMAQFFSPSPATEDQPPRCGKPAASLIPRWGMSWACALDKGHDGECAPGGNCNKHGPYICKPNEQPKCPQWPDCIPAAVPAPESPLPQKTCTCPKTQWTGSEPNDSTCELSEEEHRALAAPESVAPPQSKITSGSLTIPPEPLIEPDEPVRMIFAAPPMAETKVEEVAEEIYGSLVLTFEQYGEGYKDLPRETWVEKCAAILRPCLQVIQPPHWAKIALQHITSKEWDDEFIEQQEFESYLGWLIQKLKEYCAVAPVSGNGTEPSIWELAAQLAVRRMTAWSNADDMKSQEFRKGIEQACSELAISFRLRDPARSAQPTPKGTEAK